MYRLLNTDLSGFVQEEGGTKYRFLFFYIYSYVMMIYSYVMMPGSFIIYSYDARIPGSFIHL